jgi:hypothetical protein
VLDLGCIAGHSLFGFGDSDLSMPDTELGKVLEKTEYLQEPENDDNHHNAIQNPFDLTLHWDKAVDKP